MFAGPPAKRQRRATTSLPRIFEVALRATAAVKILALGGLRLSPFCQEPHALRQEEGAQTYPFLFYEVAQHLQVRLWMLGIQGEPRGTLCLERNTGNRGIPRSPPFSHAVLVHESTASGHTFLGASRAAWHPCARKKNNRAASELSPSHHHNFVDACSCLQVSDKFEPKCVSRMVPFQKIQGF